MTAARSWKGASGFGRVRAKGPAARTLAQAYFVAVTDVAVDGTCTALETFTSKRAAERAIAGVAGAAVFDARARLPMGARVQHAGGVCWLTNYAGDSSR